MWDRNLNTGNPIGQDAEIEVAVQTILHDAQFPSHIILPIIPKQLNLLIEVVTDIIY